MRGRTLGWSVGGGAWTRLCGSDVSLVSTGSAELNGSRYWYWWRSVLTILLPYVHAALFVFVRHVLLARCSSCRIVEVEVEDCWYDVYNRELATQL
jgi:hypothetical protein